MSCPATTRRAFEDDASALAELYADTLRDAYGGEMPADFVQPSVVEQAAKLRIAIADSNRAYFITLSGATIVGFCAVLPARDANLSPSVGEISALGVRADHRQHGHGRDLMRAAQEEASRRGWTALVLWVVTANADARAFYSREGFTPDGANKVDSRLGFSAEILRYRR